MKNILIITYWSYSDALIQAYTLPYVRIIKENLPSQSSIYLLTLEKNQDKITSSRRYEIAAKLENEGIKWLPFNYRPFGMGAFFLWIGISFQLCRLIIQKKISILHCWCTPAGAIGYFLSFLLNRILILDSYEPHAEAMVENGTWEKDSFAFKLLFWLERKQTEHASHIISATAGMHEYAKRKYYVDIKNFSVKPACVDLNLFNEEIINDKSLRHQLALDGKIVCVYAGKFGGIYLEKEIFDFIKVAADHWGKSFRFLILTNHSNEEVAAYCKLSGLEAECVVIKFVPHGEIPRYMGLADFAITPVKPIPTKRYCTPIKDGEYWALGLPVVISANISDDSEIIETNNIGAVLKEFNLKAYKQAISKIDGLLIQVDLRHKIRKIAKQYRSFEIAESVYRAIYNPKNF